MSVTHTSNGTRCLGQNRLGQPCGRRAVRDGYCTVHGPHAQDMRELGRRGGSRSPLTKLRKAADDSLREQARAVLEKALRGEDVPKAALDSARSLFSYRADAPPSHMPAVGQSTGKPIGLADLLEAAAESKILSQFGLDPGVESEWLEKLRARTPATEVDYAALITAPTPFVEERSRRGSWAPGRGEAA